MTATLAMQYVLQKVVQSSRNIMLNGLTYVEADDASLFDGQFSVDEEHVFTSSTCLVMDLASSLEVVLEFLDDTDQVTATIQEDLQGMVFIPMKIRATIRNPSRFGYTLDIPVRVVTA